MPSLSSDKALLLIGASRGLGFALAEEYLKRGWHVGRPSGAQPHRNYTLSWRRPTDDSKSIPSTSLIKIKLSRCGRAWHREGSTCCSSMPVSVFEK